MGNLDNPLYLLHWTDAVSPIQDNLRSVWHNMSNRVLKMFEKMEKWNSISVPMKIQQFVYQTGQNNSSLFMNISGNWSTIFDTLWLSISKLIGIQDSLYETTESFNFIQYHQYYLISLSYGSNSKMSTSRATWQCGSHPGRYMWIFYDFQNIQEITYMAY